MVFQYLAKKAAGYYLLWTSREVRVTKASSKDFEAIHKFNHEVFSSELQQHATNDAATLIDKHHDRNTYFVARKQNQIIGMVCITKPGADGFSVQQKMTNPASINKYFDTGVELRLLAVKREYRGSNVMWKLLRAVVKEVLEKNIQIAFISGIESRIAMYEKMGFVAIDKPCKSGKQSFVPMQMTFAEMDKLRNILCI